MLANLAPALKYLAAALTPVLLTIQSGGIPTNAQGWASLALLAIGGVVSFHISPPGAASQTVTAQQMATGVVDRLTAGPPTKQVGNAPVAVPAQTA